MQVTTCAIEGDGMANENTSVVNVITANEPVFSSFNEI